MESNNGIIKSLNDLFSENAEDTNILYKSDFFSILFQYKLIDICEFDIFSINQLFDQLRTNNNSITKENFTKLILFIYTLQIRYLKSPNNKIHSLVEENLDKEIQDELEFPEDVTNMSVSSIKSILSNRQLINSNYNILKVILDQVEKGKAYFDLCHPLLKQPEMSMLVSDELVVTIEMYYKSLYEKIFLKYFKEEEEKNLKYINILDLNHIVFDFPIFSTLNSEQITSTIIGFLSPQKFDDLSEVYKMLESVFDERQTISSIKKYFDELYLYLSEFNFSYSTLVLILASFAIIYRQDLDPVEAICYYFSDVLSLKKEKRREELEIEESIISEDSNYLPESKVFLEAQVLQENPEEEDFNFVEDFLAALDKDLPEIPSEIISMKNEISYQANKLYYNPVKNNPVKFPLETLKIELEEQKEKKTLEKEKSMIKNSKKKLRTNKNDPPAVSSSWLESVPNAETEKLKYFGDKKIGDLKHRFFKNSYKDILPNSNVYPSLINEVLIIPNSIPKNIIDIILAAFKEQSVGDYDMTIRKLEKAERECVNFKAYNIQIQLFFELTFGAIYDSLEYRLMAMKYLYKAKTTTDKFYRTDPDTALVYSYLGKLLISLREYEWAFRCFSKSKDVRENAIGGDSIDTATIYNNLGVCCYYMQSFYPAYGFFQLSYEIYKKILGVFHSRTLTIKDNISKMAQLNFNKSFEFKTMSLYHTASIKMANSIKHKK